MSYNTRNSMDVRIEFVIMYLKGGLTMGRYLDDAKAMYNYARIELQQWEQSSDEILLRDATEKTWGAVTLATNDLLESFGRRVPSGTGARHIELNAIERPRPAFPAVAYAGPFLLDGKHPAQGLLL